MFASATSSFSSKQFTDALKTAKPEVQQAMKAIEKGENDDALRKLNNIISGSPDDAQALILRACTYSLLNESKKASEDILKLCQINPNWTKEKTSMSGWLKKYPPKGGQEKTRFFYLKDRFFLYYKDAHLEEPLAGLCLQEFSLTVSPTINTRFELTVPDRYVSGKEKEKNQEKSTGSTIQTVAQKISTNKTYVLEAKTEEDKVAWLAALKAVQEKSVKYTLLNPPTENTNTGLFGGIASKLGFGSGSSEDGEYLFKRGQKNPGWKQRYMVIRAGILYYYVSPSDKTPKGATELKNCKVLPVAGDGNDGKYKFLVEAPGKDGKTRKLYIYAESEAQRTKWITKIREASQVNTVKSISAQTGTDVVKMVEEAIPVKDNDEDTGGSGVRVGGIFGDKSKKKVEGQKQAKNMTIIEENVDSQKPATTSTNKTLSKDLENVPEISELVSPTPVTSVFLSDKLYKNGNEDKIRNEEAIKRGRELGGILEQGEWGGDDGEESDDFIPDEDLQGDNCTVM